VLWPEAGGERALPSTEVPRPLPDDLLAAQANCLPQFGKQHTAAALIRSAPARRV